MQVNDSRWAQYLWLLMRTVMTASDEEFVVTILSDGRMDPVNGIQGMAIWRILNRGWVVTAEESQRGFAQLVI